MKRMGLWFALCCLQLAGCSGGFKGEPWLIDSQGTTNTRLRPIDVATPAPTPDPVIAFRTPIAPNDSGAFQWVEEPAIVQYGEANVVSPNDPQRTQKLGLGYAVRFSKDPEGSKSLLIMLEGGNGCINETICNRTFHPVGIGTIEAENLRARGLLDPTGIPTSDLPLAVLRKAELGDVFAADIFQDTPENPFAGWNYAFLPYLSGDQWMGDNDADVVFYNRRADKVDVTDSNGTVISVPRPLNPDGSVDVPNGKIGKRYRFRGRANVRAILSRLVPSFPNVERIVIAGYSAGGLGAELNFERITLAFRRQRPNVRTALLADSGFWIRNQMQSPTSSSGITGMAACSQKRIRDLFRFDRGLPAGCTTCFGADGAFSEGLVTYVKRTYPSSHLGHVMSPGDETLQAVLATGKVAKNADGVSVPCGRLDYAPGLTDLGFYGVPVDVMTKQIVAFDTWLESMGATNTSVMQVKPISDHPQGKGGENHVWLLWPGLVFDDNNRSVGCSPPNTNCDNQLKLSDYLHDFIDRI